MILGSAGNLSRDEVVARSRAFLAGIANDKAETSMGRPVGQSNLCT